MDYTFVFLSIFKVLFITAAFTLTSINYFYPVDKHSFFLAKFNLKDLTSQDLFQGLRIEEDHQDDLQSFQKTLETIAIQNNLTLAELFSFPDEIYLGFHGYVCKTNGKTVDNGFLNPVKGFYSCLGHTKKPYIISNVVGSQLLDDWENLSSRIDKNSFGIKLPRESFLKLSFLIVSFPLIFVYIELICFSFSSLRFSTVVRSQRDEGFYYTFFTLALISYIVPFTLNSTLLYYISNILSKHTGIKTVVNFELFTKTNANCTLFSVLSIIFFFNALLLSIIGTVLAFKDQKKHPEKYVTEAETFRKQQKLYPTNDYAIV